MTKDDLKNAVIEIIKSIAPDENLEGIDSDKPLREQIDLDSMDFLDIVMELRIRYSVDVPEADYMQLNTLAGCVNYLMPKMEKV